MKWSVLICWVLLATMFVPAGVVRADTSDDSFMTTTDDRETELLADALAQTYSDAVLAQVGDHLPLTDEVFKVAWYRVAERAKELRKAPKQPRRE